MNTSGRKVVIFILLITVMICAFIIVRPRLWVKNKTAKVIVDGRLSEDVRLFHGSDGRLLFYMRDEPDSVYYYSAESGLLRCDKLKFLGMKLLAFGARSSPKCGTAFSPATMREQSVDFARQGQHVTVSWQAAPR